MHLSIMHLVFVYLNYRINYLYRHYIENLKIKVCYKKN